MNATYDAARARRYWRHAPSGAGKHDTAMLASASDSDLLATWHHALSARLRAYPEEDCFLRITAEAFGGRRLLSIGSGLGFHEIAYANSGVDVTCCDIVESNLQVIRRVAASRGLESLMTVAAADPTAADFGREFDIVFVYGSLMTMPTAQQEQLLANLQRHMHRSSVLVLMLYTWDFARATCGWEDRSEFDPVRFAQATDPSVGDEHCPWSDWHDDVKLLDLCGGTLAIQRRQLWQQDWYVWYALTHESLVEGEPQPFFRQSALETGDVVQRFGPEVLLPQAARVTATNGDGLEVRTEVNQFGYALTSPEFTTAGDSLAGNGVHARVSLGQGGLSIGVLDVEADRFVGSQTIIKPGDNFACVPTPELKGRFRVVVSNHSPAGPASSSFRIDGLEIVRRPSVIDALCE